MIRDFLNSTKKLVLFGIALGVTITIVILPLFSLNLKTLNLSSIGTSPSMEGGAGTPSYDRDFGYSPPSNKAQDSSGAIQAESSPIPRHVIRTGALSLIVKAAEEAARSITNAITTAGGYVEQLNLYEVTEGVKNGSMIVRVPDADLTEIMEQVKGFAVKTQREDINSQDVTDQLVDLDARIKNLTTAEARYISILEKAKTVEEILQVEARLSETRGTIERLNAEKKNVSDRVSMSTISITLISEPDIQVFGLTWHPLYVAKQAVRDLLEGLTKYTDGLIRFVILLPIVIITWGSYILIALVGIVIIRKLFFWGKKRFFNRQVSS